MKRYKCVSIYIWRKLICEILKNLYRLEYKGENILNFLAVHDKELSLDNMRIQDEI